VSALHSAILHLRALVMSEDLIERFKRGKKGKPVQRTQVEVQLLPQKLNTRISKYYEPQRQPSEAGPWLDRHETPSSSEILDIESNNTSNSDIVEIVPNKETGGWESKGEPLHHSFFQIVAPTDLTADAYLSAHYELFREDAVRPLREAICQVRRDPDRNEDAFKGTIGIYQDVSDI
jgi:helicase required for RNAi-mediated heterochromatin assembly 1